MNITNSLSPFINTWQMSVVNRLNTHVFAIQFLFGIGGNALNLLVLMSKKMRSRTNLLFAAMAFTDLAFFFVYLPHLLFYAGCFNRLPMLKSIYYTTNINLTALGNWFSAASIWLMLAATIERVTVIRRPFQASIRVLTWRFVMLIIAIIGAAFVVTFYHHVRRRTDFIDGKYIQRPINANITLPLTIFNTITVFALPCIVSAILNILLIMALKQQTFSLAHTTNDLRITEQLSTSRMRNEKKVTFMVVVILTSFIVCNAPSSILYVMQLCLPIDAQSTATMTMMYAIGNTLVITGKVLNFVLFCMSSNHFRKHLLARIKACIPQCGSLQRRKSDSATRVTIASTNGTTNLTSSTNGTMKSRSASFRDDNRTFFRDNNRTFRGSHIEIGGYQLIERMPSKLDRSSLRSTLIYV